MSRAQSTNTVRPAAAAAVTTHQAERTDMPIRVGGGKQYGVRMRGGYVTRRQLVLGSSPTTTVHPPPTAQLHVIAEGDTDDTDDVPINVITRASHNEDNVDIDDNAPDDEDYADDDNVSEDERHARSLSSMRVLLAHSPTEVADRAPTRMRLDVTTMSDKEFEAFCESKREWARRDYENLRQARAVEITRLREERPALEMADALNPMREVEEEIKRYRSQRRGGV